MTTHKSTLWIDLTMLINSAGQLTGIQRVEYNVARRYAKLPHVKFCVFHKDRNMLTEFDFKHVTYKVEMLQHQSAGASAVPAVQVGLPRRVLGKAKRTIAPYLSTHHKAALRKQYHRLKTFGQAAPAEQQVVFGAHDTLLILSGDWSDGTFAEMISNLRQKIGFKIVQIVYDMLPAFSPAFFVPGMAGQFTNYMQVMFANCDGVLAISEATKRDVLAFAKQHNIKAAPVRVFRLGDDFVEREPVKPALPVKKNDFILCVCTIEVRKNHMALYYAAREALARGADFPTIVLVGRRRWLVNDFLYLVDNDPILSKKILFTNCTDQELAWLYKNCQFTVFPSFSEGWGLGIAESLFYGKFCVSSNTSSMPEIGGDLVTYVSPNDPLGLMEQIVHYHANPAELQAKEKAIQSSYKTTTWDQTFVQVRDFIDSL